MEWDQESPVFVEFLLTGWAEILVVFFSHLPLEKWSGNLEHEKWKWQFACVSVDDVPNYKLK